MERVERRLAAILATEWRVGAQPFLTQSGHTIRATMRNFSCRQFVAQIRILENPQKLSPSGPSWTSSPNKKRRKFSVHHNRKRFDW